MDEEANGYALVLAFLPVWIVGMNGYSLVDHGVAVYNASIVDGTTQMMYSGQPGLGGSSRTTARCSNKTTIGKLG